MEGKGEGKNQKLIARARCGNLEERNKQWMSEDGKLCELCLLEEGTIKHKIEERQKFERKGLSIKDIMKDQKVEKTRKRYRIERGEIE